MLASQTVHTTSQSRGYGIFLILAKNTAEERPQRRVMIPRTWVILDLSPSTINPLWNRTTTVVDRCGTIVLWF